MTRSPDLNRNNQLRLHTLLVVLQNLLGSNRQALEWERLQRRRARDAAEEEARGKGRGLGC